MSENETTWYDNQRDRMLATPHSDGTVGTLRCMDARTHLEVPIAVEREPLLPAQAPEERRVSRYERGSGGHTRVEQDELGPHWSQDGTQMGAAIWDGESGREEIRAHPSHRSSVGYVPVRVERRVG
jgi:hypothetical protein